MYKSAELRGILIISPLIPGSLRDTGSIYYLTVFRMAFRTTTEIPPRGPFSLLDETRSRNS